MKLIISLNLSFPSVKLAEQFSPNRNVTFKVHGSIWLMRGRFLLLSSDMYLLSETLFLLCLGREMGVVPQDTSRWRPTTHRAGNEVSPGPQPSPSPCLLHPLQPLSCLPPLLSHSRTQAESHTKHFVFVSRFLEGQAEG